jgi:hypothetical protein
MMAQREPRLIMRKRKRLFQPSGGRGSEKGAQGLDDPPPCRPPSDSDALSSAASSTLAVALTPAGLTTPDEMDECDTSSEAEYSSSTVSLDSTAILHRTILSNLSMKESPLHSQYDDQGDTLSDHSESNQEEDDRPQSNATASRDCAGCKGLSDVFWCNGCHIRMCNNCWGKQLAHTEEAPGHSKTTLADMEKLNRILNMTGMEGATTDYLRAEYSSKWFGVKIKNGPHWGILNTTNRYRELTMATGFQGEQYPALVSFVGETGAGKSSLISALVKAIPPQAQRANHAQLLKTCR